MPRVLIAEDEESMRTLVARAVAMDGHATVTAEDGAEALEILSREPRAFARPVGSQRRAERRLG